MKKRLLLLFVMVCALFFVLGKQSSAQVDDCPEDFCIEGWVHIADGAAICDCCESLMLCCCEMKAD